MNPTSYIANFDSAYAMIQATARYLRGEDIPAMGVLPKPAVHVLKPLAPALNRLSRNARETIYIWSGWNEAIPPEKLREVSAEAVARWVVGEYPKRRYPAVRW